MLVYIFSNDPPESQIRERRRNFENNPAHRKIVNIKAACPPGWTMGSSYYTPSGKTPEIPRRVMRPWWRDIPTPRTLWNNIRGGGSTPTPKGGHGGKSI